MTRRIDAYAACFADVDRHFTAASALSQETLLYVFGAEGLRRQYLVVRFLVGRLSLAWNSARTEGLAEAGRIKAALAAFDAAPWGPVLRAYHDHLAHDETLRPKTVRLYMKAAASLLERSGHAELTSLRQAEVNRYLRHKPGQRASLMRFLAYHAQATGAHLAVVRKKLASWPKSREDAFLKVVRDLLDRLDRADSAAQGRALLAAALAKLFLVSLTSVLALTASDVVNDGPEAILWPNGLALRLTPPLTDMLRRWASLQGGYLFPGRNIIQPLSRDAVRYHVLQSEK